MRQTTLSAPLEVKPDSLVQLKALIDALRARTAPGQPDQYDRLSTKVPALHFFSLSVFPHQAYDPLFVLEANFDGPPGVFWGQMEAALGEELRGMLRCCKQPLDEDGPLFAAVTKAGSRAPVAPYFEARTQTPSVFHHGNRGLTRDRILDEARLFEATRAELAKPPPAGGLPHASLAPQDLHARLRAALLPAFPWLNSPPPVRIPLTERMADYGRLALFAVAVLICLTAPGIILSFMTTWSRGLMVIGAPTVLIGLLVLSVRKPRPGEAAGGKTSILLTLLGRAPLILALLAAYLVAATAILVGPMMAIRGGTWAAVWQETFVAVGLGLASLPLMALIVVLWLRHLERRDSSQDAPKVDPAALREMIRREDWIAQNHMGSIVMIKAGVLRTILVKAGHLGLGLVLRVIAADGYLGSMRTVHFAHWAFVNNSSRLLFLSNFDHSWDSYLDDFIEKASVGLTLAWGTGVGFPPSRFLVLDGASHGRQFKAWALASRAVSRFWYSAYRNLTVDQIERQARIAIGLRRKTLSQKEASAWRTDL